MLNNILNLKGVSVLDKKQQYGIIGGDQECRLTMIMDTGDTLVLHFDNYSNGEQGSSEANQNCLEALAGNATRCWYNCSHDGYEQ